MKRKIKRLLDYINKDIILIYQMGKVGSTSIEKSLSNTYYNVEHVHSFHSPVMYEMFNGIRSAKYNNPLKNRISERISKLIRKRIIKKKKKLKVVTLVREPISRNISMFFQGIHIALFELAKRNNTRFEENVNKNKLRELFMDVFNHEYGVRWFDDEFKKTFDIDIYKYNFDKEKGFSFIIERDIQIMVIKMEKLNELEKEIGDFLNISEFKLHNVNRGGKKWYADLYNDFKNEFIPTIEYVDMLYETKFMRHFYTKKEIDEFRRKWLKN